MSARTARCGVKGGRGWHLEWMAPVATTAMLLKRCCCTDVLRALTASPHPTAVPPVAAAAAAAAATGFGALSTPPAVGGSRYDGPLEASSSRTVEVPLATAGPQLWPLAWPG